MTVLSELAKSTLKSYVKKALDTNNEKSISNLASRGGYDHGQSGGDDPTAGYADDRKSVKRSQGVQRAVDRLTKEEVEMTTISESVQDIVLSTIQNDPQALQSSLDAALREKIATALEAKKQEIAQNLVGLGEGTLDEMDRKEKRGWNRTAKMYSKSAKYHAGSKASNAPELRDDNSDAAKVIVAGKKLTNKQREGV